VHLDRAGDAALGLELGEQPVDVVQVLRPSTFGHHDDVEAVADLGDQRRQVVEHPGRVERVDPRPQLGAPRSAVRATSTRPARAAALLAAGRVLEVAEQDVDLRDSSGSLATIRAFDGSKKWIIRRDARGSRAAGPAHRRPAGGGSPWGCARRQARATVQPDKPGTGPSVGA
jgi:hypothetical protein